MSVDIRAPVLRPGWRLVPALAFALWAGVYALFGALRWPQIVIALASITVLYANERVERLVHVVMPFVAVGILYDAMRFVKNWGLTASGVHLCDLRSVEASLFGSLRGGRVTTVHDWLQSHSNRWLDVYCAVPYATYLIATIAYAVYLYRRQSKAPAPLAAQRLANGFLLVNIAGFLTYHLYPAAPPWYFHAHGCVIDLGARPSPGPNLARVDELLTIPYFAGYYGHSSAVFGAMPSLHVAYPLLMLFAGWSLHRAVGRGLLSVYWLSMCFAAVYLDHHWVLDVVVGAFYALVVCGVLVAWESRQRGANTNVVLVEP